MLSQKNFKIAIFFAYNVLACGTFFHYFSKILEPYLTGHWEWAELLILLPAYYLMSKTIKAVTKDIEIYG